MSEAREPRNSVPISDEIRSFVRNFVGAVKSYRTFDKFNTDLKKELRKQGMDDSDAAVADVVEELKNEGLITEVNGRGYGKGASFDSNGREEVDSDTAESIEDFEEEDSDEEEPEWKKRLKAAREEKEDDNVDNQMEVEDISEDDEEDIEENEEEVEDEEELAIEEDSDEEEPEWKKRLKAAREEKEDDNVDNQMEVEDISEDDEEDIEDIEESEEEDEEDVVIEEDSDEDADEPEWKKRMKAARAQRGLENSDSETEEDLSKANDESEATVEDSDENEEEPEWKKRMKAARAQKGLENANSETTQEVAGVEEEDEDDTEEEEEETEPTVDTRDAARETGTSADDSVERAPAAAPAQHHSAHMNERQFSRWSRRIEALHRQLLHIITNLEKGELSKLRKEFKDETGQDWNEAFELHTFLAEKKAANIVEQHEERDAHERQFSSQVEAATAQLQDLLARVGLPHVRTGEAHLDELSDIVISEGVDHRRAVDILVNDLYEVEMRQHNDGVRAERAIFFVLARMVDKLEQYHAEEAIKNVDDNPQELQDARDAFLQAQEDFNEFERKILHNPFTKKKRRAELLERLEAARTTYETESARVIAGRAHRFLNELNKQIDAEIDIRSARREGKGDGFLASLKNTFYAAYKWTSDMSLDKLHRNRKYGDRAAANGEDPPVEGNEPTKGRTLLKMVNVRSVAGAALGFAGLMSMPLLKGVWRGSVGLGTALGVYEGLKARTTAELQAKTHDLLRLFAGPKKNHPDREAVLETMQEIRMRAALDGKTVDDDRFPLHESFAKLRTILKHEREELPKENREEAYQNKDKILAALKGINTDLEDQITSQSSRKKIQALKAAAVGGASAFALPWIVSKIGDMGQWIVDIFDGDGAAAIGDPALSAEVETSHTGIATATEQIEVPTPIEIEPQVGEGIRVALARGEGAYHAVHKILDELSPTDQAALGEAIATEHPEWVSRDASGNITNLDRVLRNWRHDIVDSAILDDGREAMIYDASTGEYGVMLDEGAEFSLIYDADGYPHLRLHGGAGDGHYEVLDERLVRTVDGGRGTFMTAEQYQEQLTPSMPETPTPVPVETSATIGTPELVPDGVEDAVAQVASDSTSLDTAFADGAAAAGNATDTSFAVRDTAPREVFERDSAGVTGEPSLDGAEEVLEESLPTVFTLDGGQTVAFEYSGGDVSEVRIDTDLLSNRDVQYALLDVDTPYSQMGGYGVRTAFDETLKQIYVMDEVLDEMIVDGRQGTPEYDYLVSAVEANMQRAAEQAQMDVGVLFDSDLVDAYGFDVPTAAVAAEPAPVDTVPAEPVDTAPVTPDVYADITISEDIVDRIRAVSGDLGRSEQMELEAYIRDMQTVGREFDVAVPGSSEQASLAQQLRSLRENIIDIVEEVEGRTL